VFGALVVAVVGMVGSSFFDFSKIAISALRSKVDLPDRITGHLWLLQEMESPSSGPQCVRVPGLRVIWL
jgi:hypothetical protein